MNEADEKLLNEFVAQLEKIVAEKSAKQTAAPTYPRVKPEDRKGSWYNAYAALYASAAERFSVDEMVNCAGIIGREAIKMADLAMHALAQGDMLIEMLAEKESPKPCSFCKGPCIYDT